MNNLKLVFFLSCLFAAMLTAPVITAAPHGSGGGGHSFGGRPGMGMAGRPGMGNWHGGNWGNHFHHHDHDVIFIGDFGFPWWWGWGWGPWWGWDWGYPYYGYGYPYGYGYGYGDYGYGQYGDASHSRVAELQRRLARAGYYHGSIDGVLGPQTRRAIRAYGRDHGYAS